jgi:hypothetical protein
VSLGGGFLFGLTDDAPEDTIKLDLEIEWGPDGGDDDDDDHA